MTVRHTIKSKVSERNLRLTSGGDELVSLRILGNGVPITAAIAVDPQELIDVMHEMFPELEPAEPPPEPFKFFRGDRVRIRAFKNEEASTEMAEVMFVGESRLFVRFLDDGSECSADPAVCVFMYPAPKSEPVAPS